MPRIEATRSLLNDYERFYDGPLPARALAQIEAANRFARLSPRNLLISELAGWQHEIDDRRTLLKLLSAKVEHDRARLPPVASQHRAYREGTLESTIATWRMHASLLLNAARQARRVRREIAAMRPALVEG